MNLKKQVVTYYHFYCPGCKHEHTYTIREDGTGWQFNGDINKPSFTPSLLNRITDGPGKENERCHLYVTDGKIVYCQDCYHEYAGKTIDLIDKY